MLQEIEEYAPHRSADLVRLVSFAITAAVLPVRRCGQTRPKFDENTESEAAPTLIRPWSRSKSRQLPCADVAASLGVLAPLRIDQMGMSDPDVSDQAFAEAVEVGYCLSLLFSHRYEEVMELTKDWRESGRFWRQHGTFRASAIKRMAEKKSRRDRLGAVNQALEILDDVIGDRGGETEGWILGQLSKMIAELLHCAAEGYELAEEEQSLMVSALNIIDKYIFYAEKGEARRSQIIAEFSALEMEGNPFRGRSALGMERSLDEARRGELIEEGFAELTITNVPNTGHAFPNYLFGRADEGTDYFCHFTAFELRGGSWEEWRKVGVGERMMIIPGAVPPGKGSARAEQIEICYF